MKYMAVVHKDADSAFGVSFPDLPGCFGAGETREEALENAKVSLREYAQSMEEMDKALPNPRTIDDILSEPSLSDVIEGGEYFIAVPLITVGTRKRVNISMDDRVLNAIDDACKVAGVNRSAFLTEVACDWLKTNTDTVVSSEEDPLPAKRRA